MVKNSKRGRKSAIKKKNAKWNTDCKSKRIDSGCGSAIYGLGFIGAVVYYISSASGFWVGVLGVLKALVWPAFLVFELMKFLAM